MTEEAFFLPPYSSPVHGINCGAWPRSHSAGRIAFGGRCGQTDGSWKIQSRLGAQSAVSIDSIKCVLKLADVFHHIVFDNLPMGETTGRFAIN
ncbi:MAG TPA: hypothetical protein V6D17_16640 [Candidatus Obscuribacterales bacterium]